jgi:type I restriction enzyme S subunit
VTRPGGWELKTLGDLGRYINGRGFKKQEWRVEGRPIIRIQNLTGSSDVFNYFDGIADERHVVHPGDLLVSWAATLGAYFWRGPEAVLNQHIFKVESFIDPRFHKYLLDQKFDELMRHTHGSGMVHITRGAFDSIPVAIPPLPEQRRIVTILEDHLSRLDAADAYLDASRRRGAVLHNQLLEAELAAVDLEEVPFVELLTIGLANGKSVPTRLGGFPVLRLTALRNGRIDLGERKEGAWTIEDASKFLVRRGDFLISRGNGSLRLVGRGGLVSDEPDPVAFPDTFIRARPKNERISSEFLALVWNAPGVRRQIEKAAKTTAGIYKVNQKDLDAVLIKVPSLEDQSRIIGSVSQSRDALMDLMMQSARGMQRSAALRRSLLAAAFSGNLTTTSPEIVSPGFRAAEQFF